MRKRRHRIRLRNGLLVDDSGPLIVKQGLHGHTVRPTRLDNNVFEVMFDRLKRIFGCRASSSNGLMNLTLVGGASLSNVWFECVNGSQTSNLSSEG